MSFQFNSHVDCDIRVRKDPSGSCCLRAATLESHLLAADVSFVLVAYALIGKHDFILPSCPFRDGIKRQQWPLSDNR